MSYEPTVTLRHRLVVARQLARQLRDEKSDHPWSVRECDLLGELCDLLGVEPIEKTTTDRR